MSIYSNPEVASLFGHRNSWRWIECGDKSIFFMIRNFCLIYVINLRLPKRLADCKLFTQSFSKHPLCDYFSTGTLYCTKKAHHVSKRPQCRCKLCIKDSPGSLKSQCVNKISEFTFYPISLRKWISKFACFYSHRGIFICVQCFWYVSKPHSANKCKCKS